MAYVGSGIIYFNSDETSRAAENLQKAYQLRSASASGRNSASPWFMTRWSRETSRRRAHPICCLHRFTRVTAKAFSNLATIDTYLGHYDESLAANQKALALNPAAAQNYSNLMIDYMYFNRLQEAVAIARDAESRNLDSPFIHSNLYLVAFPGA